MPGTNSARRKPAAGMLLEAERDYRLDLARSWFIGDKASDIECGRNAGARTILVQTGYGAEETNCGADWIARDLAHAADIILKESNE
jgi:D-glycero-D-manno-heptose 1,7-bisphosphate phosphatase